MVNEIQLIGHLGATPEIKEKVAKLRICTNSPSLIDGQWKDNPIWHSVKGFGSLIERFTPLNKGDLVRVVGQMTYNEYNEKIYPEIKAFNVKVLKRAISPEVQDLADKVDTLTGEIQDQAKPKEIVNDDLPF